MLSKPVDNRTKEPKMQGFNAYFEWFFPQKLDIVYNKKISNICSIMYSKLRLEFFLTYFYEWFFLLLKH